MSDNAFFDDLMGALHEVEEYQNGNLQLQSDIVTVPDEEVNFRNIFVRLADRDKAKLLQYADELLQASNA